MSEPLFQQFINDRLVFLRLRKLVYLLIKQICLSSMSVFLSHPQIKCKKWVFCEYHLFKSKKFHLAEIKILVLFDYQSLKLKANHQEKFETIYSDLPLAQVCHSNLNFLIIFALCLKYHIYICIPNHHYLIWSGLRSKQ